MRRSCFPILRPVGRQYVPRSESEAPWAIVRDGMTGVDGMRYAPGYAIAVQRRPTMKKRSSSQKSQKPTVKSKGTEERVTIGMDLALYLAAALVLLGSIRQVRAQTQQPADHPVVTVQGQTYTPRSILARNMGTPEDQTTPFPPHKIIGNIYYVGTRTLSSFLVVTPRGNILIDSTYERNVRTIQKSVEQLGFKLSDIKILLGSHAHGDHQEGDALLKELTGAQVMAMAEDVPALQAMKPGGKEHPIDRVVHDGDTVTLGGTTLTAHLTPGHTRGCTTWTMKAQEAGRSYDVVIIGSLGVNPGVRLVNNAAVPD